MITHHRKETGLMAMQRPHPGKVGRWPANLGMPETGTQIPAMVESPPGSGLFVAALVEDPPGSGLYRMAGIA